MDILMLAFLTAVAFFVLLLKIGITKFTKHSVLTDVVISAGLAMLFMGTFSGMVTGLIAGLFISLFLYVAKIIEHTARLQKWD